MKSKLICALLSWFTLLVVGFTSTNAFATVKGDTSFQGQATAGVVDDRPMIDMPIMDPDLSWPTINDGAPGQIGFSVGDLFTFSKSSIGSRQTGQIGICKSLSDSMCKPGGRNGPTWWIVRVLPTCAKTSATDECVESLKVTKDGITREAEFVSYVEKEGWTPDPAKGFPVAGSGALWSNPFDADPTHFLYVSVSGNLQAEKGITGPFRLSDFGAEVIAVAAPGLIRIQNNDFVKCAFFNPENSPNCGLRIPYDENIKISLALHLNPKLTGWLGGRLENPSLSISALSKSLNRLEVAAAPIDVAAYEVLFDTPEAPALAKTILGDSPGCATHRCIVGLEASGPLAMKWLLGATKLSKNKSSKLLPRWSFSQQGFAGVHQCLQSDTKIMGLVTTNATTYQANPPVFSGGYLSYKVASMHYLPDGKTAYEGKYDLILRSEAARCLYRFTSAPVTAEVSVTSSDGVTKVQSQSVSESKGWLHMAAYGFHFSNPTIRIKIKQK